MLEKLNDIADQLDAHAPTILATREIAHGEMTLTVAPTRIVDALRFLRDDVTCGFVQLIDLCAVDRPERELRFEVVYHLLSYRLNARLRVKTAIGEDDTAPSVADVFPAADWYEREAFDMYGVVFDGHPDLRRLLTDYGFHGHPLRKDFPLSGHVEVRYDEEQKRVVYEPVKLVQEYREFDFLSPWEGARYALPGDEKAESEG